MSANSHFNNLPAYKAPSIGQSKETDMIAAELEYQKKFASRLESDNNFPIAEAINTQNENQLSKVKEFLKGAVNGSKEYLSNFTKNIANYRDIKLQKFILPAIVALGTFGAASAFENKPAAAMVVGTSVKTENVQIKNVTHVENSDVSSPKAQQIKSDMGLGGIEDDVYSKLIQKIHGDSENKHDIAELKKDIKPALESDGFDREIAVKKLKLNYLKDQTATTPTTPDSASGETKTPVASLFNTIEGVVTWNMENPTVKELSKLACPTNPSDCKAETLNNYIENTLGYKANPNQLNPDSLKELITKKTETNNPPAKANPQPSQSPSPTITPQAIQPAEDGGTDRVTETNSLKINTSKGKFTIKNSNIKLPVGEQTLGDETTSIVNQNVQYEQLNFTKPELIENLKSTSEKKVPYSQKVLERRSTILYQIDKTGKATKENLTELDNVLVEVNTAKANLKNIADRQKVYDQATAKIDALERKIASNKSPENQKENNPIGWAGWFGTILGGLTTTWATVNTFRSGKENKKLQLEIEKRTETLKKNEEIMKATSDLNIKLNKSIAELQRQLENINNPQPNNPDTTQVDPDVVVQTPNNPILIRSSQIFPDINSQPEMNFPKTDLISNQSLEKFTKTQIINYLEGLSTQAQLQLDDDKKEVLKDIIFEQNKLLNDNKFERQENIQRLYKELRDLGIKQEVALSIANITITNHNRQNANQKHSYLEITPKAVATPKSTLETHTANLTPTELLNIDFNEYRNLPNQKFILTISTMNDARDGSKLPDGENLPNELVLFEAGNKNSNYLLLEVPSSTNLEIIPNLDSFNNMSVSLLKLLYKLPNNFSLDNKQYIVAKSAVVKLASNGQYQLVTKGEIGLNSPR